MAEDVVPRCNGLGDLNHPAVVVLYELVIAPGARHFRAINQPDAVNLEELKLRLIDSLAALATVRQVIHDRSVV